MWDPLEKPQKKLMISSKNTQLGISIVITTMIDTMRLSNSPNIHTTYS